MSKKFIRIGEQYVTNGGWKAVVCNNDYTVFHDIDGGKLFSHNSDGRIRSSTVNDDYTLAFLLIPMEREF